MSGKKGMGVGKKWSPERLAKWKLARYPSKVKEPSVVEQSKESLEEPKI